MARKITHSEFREAFTKGTRLDRIKAVERLEDELCLAVLVNPGKGGGTVGTRCKWVIAVLDDIVEAVRGGNALVDRSKPVLDSGSHDEWVALLEQAEREAKKDLRLLARVLVRFLPDMLADGDSGWQQAKLYRYSYRERAWRWRFGLIGGEDALRLIAAEIGRSSPSKG